MVFFIMKKNGHPLPFANTVIYSVAFTTVCWLITAFVGPATSRERLTAFYRKVQPAGLGWTKVRLEAGVTEAEAALHGDHMGLATLGWVTGCLAIWSSLFAIGNFLYGRMPHAWGMLAVFVVNAFILIFVVRKLWRPNVAGPEAKILSASRP